LDCPKHKKTKKFVSWENVVTLDNKNPAKNKHACFIFMVIKDIKQACIPAQSIDLGRRFSHIGL